jgi:putative DNA primase/helicase
MSDPMKEAALEYAARGWHVFPLHTITDGTCTCTRGDQCESPGKHPRTPRGLDDATSSTDDVDYFWDKHPSSNIGIVCGPSGIAVVDIDTPEARSILEEHIDFADLPDCPIVKTSRGWHLYYSDPHGDIHPSIGRGQYKGIDLRAGPSYVVAPPSIHHSGHVYEWTRA